MTGVGRNRISPQHHTQPIYDCASASIAVSVVGMLTLTCCDICGDVDLL